MEIGQPKKKGEGLIPRPFLSCADRPESRTLKVNGVSLKQLKHLKHLKH
jgi:hypothetical protein